MKRNKRLIPGITFIFIFILVCIIFRNFLYHSILQPLAFSFLYLLRILVFSVHQAIVWYLFIGLICVFFIFKYVPRRSSSPLIEEYSIKNIHLEKLSTLNRYFWLQGNGDFYKKSIKEELKMMIVSHYAAEKRLNSDYILYNRFENREIEIPEEIYTFLFSKDKSKPDRFNWLRIENSGKKKEQDFLTGVEQCLSYLENVMEIQSETD